MSLVDQWQAIERSLPEGWGDARLRLTVAEDADPERAAALLGPATPGRHGRAISFYAARRGAGPSPELVSRLLRLLDQEGIEGELELVGSDSPPAAAEGVARWRTFASAWDAEIAALPEDWSDLYAEVELASSDYLERAALLLAPLNPAQWKADARAKPARPGSGAASALGSKPGFRFRVARRFGYGASPEMARRCFERLDEEGIRGEVRVLHALSDTRPVQTQGPVWYLGGRTV